MTTLTLKPSSLLSALHWFRDDAPQLEVTVVRQLSVLAQVTSELTWTEFSGQAPAEHESRGPVRARIVSRSWCGSYAVASSRFDPAVVGAKSLNTAALRVGRLQAVVLAPNTTPLHCDESLPRACPASPYSAEDLLKWPHVILSGISDATTASDAKCQCLRARLPRQCQA